MKTVHPFSLFTSEILCLIFGLTKLTSLNLYQSAYYLNEGIKNLTDRFMYYPNKHVNIDINLLYYKLNYYLAIIMINQNMSNTLDERKIILDSLQFADNYRDAKELKRKLFFQYMGLPFGQELNINIDNPTISDLLELAIILKK